MDKLQTLDLAFFSLVYLLRPCSPGLPALPSESSQPRGLHVLVPTQATALVVAFGLIAQGVSVWNLRRAIILVGGAIGVPLVGNCFAG